MIQEQRTALAAERVALEEERDRFRASLGSNSRTRLVNAVRASSGSSTDAGDAGMATGGISGIASSTSLFSSSQHMVFQGPALNVSQAHNSSTKKAGGGVGVNIASNVEHVPFSVKLYFLFVKWFLLVKIKKHNNKIEN